MADLFDILCQEIDIRLLVSKKCILETLYLYIYKCVSQLRILKCILETLYLYICVSQLRILNCIDFMMFRNLFLCALHMSYSIDLVNSLLLFSGLMNYMI